MKNLNFLKYKTPAYETIDKLWKGSIDMHIHIAPDPVTVRRFDAIQTAFEAQEAGMKAIVLKSVTYPTTQLAAVARHAAPNVKCVGSINIEYATTCGLNDFTALIVENHAKMGCKVLWMPTFDAAYARNSIPGAEGTGITLIDANGILLPEVTEILKVVKNYNMVLCSGHVSYNETVSLFEEAIKMGITKMVATHPMVDIIWDPMTMAEMKHLADMGAYIEHVYRSCMPLNAKTDPMDYVMAINEIGAERTILATDFAQISDTSPAEGMRQFIATMLQLGVDEKEIELMAKINPAKLLDIDIVS